MTKDFAENLLNLMNSLQTAEEFVARATDAVDCIRDELIEHGLPSTIPELQHYIAQHA